MRRAVVSLLAAFLIFPGPPAWARQQPAPSGDFDQAAARAEQARAAGQFDEAVGLYRKALSLRPQWAEGWWYLGTLLYERDAFADAAAAFEKAATLSPNAGTAWAMLGLCEFRLGRYEDALEHIQQGRRLGADADPQLGKVALYHEGLLLLGKGEFERAQEALGLLARDGVENENLTVALGLSVLRISFSDLLAGDAALRELVRRAGRAEHLAAQNKLDQALAEYDRLAADYPKTPNVQYAYGYFLVRSNQEEKAVEAFKRELENTPSHLLARLGIADTKIKIKDAAGGLPYAEEAVKLAPKSPLAHFLLGVLLFEAGQVERAVSELEIAETLLPGEPQVYFQLGRAYARANRKEDAARARATFERLNRQAAEGTQKAQPR